jgi:hypothetical protein
VFLRKQTLYASSKLTIRLNKAALIANSSALLSRRSHSGNFWQAARDERIEENLEAERRGEVEKWSEEEALAFAPTSTCPGDSIIFLQDNMEWLKEGGKRFHNILKINGRIGRKRTG